MEEGETIEAVRARLVQRLQGSAEVERPRKRGEQIELLLASFRIGLFFVSLIALFVGFFLIYNTVSVSVIQRRREIGTLRCLGMKRGQLLRLIVVEALVLALFGSFVGSAFGWLLAQAALVAVGQTVGNLFSLVDVAPGIFTLRELGLALASGVAVAVLAALHPALEAIRVSPLDNARQTAWNPVFRGKDSWATRLGLLCLGAAPLLILVPVPLPEPVQKFSVGIIGMLVFLLGLAFFCPLIVNYGLTMVLAMGAAAARCFLGGSPACCR